MAHSLLSARVQRGTVSLTGGREVTCVKGLQAPGSSSDAALSPTLGLSLMQVARRWFQFLPGPCLLPERHPCRHSELPRPEPEEAFL